MKRGRALVARQAHNLEVEGSIPSPATKNSEDLFNASPLFLPRSRKVSQNTKEQVPDFLLLSRLYRLTGMLLIV